MFGAPWMIAYDESVKPFDWSKEGSEERVRDLKGKFKCFWGSDRLESLAYYLDLPYPIHSSSKL